MRDILIDLDDYDVGEYISVGVRHNSGGAVNITSKYMNVNAVMIREIV